MIWRLLASIRRVIRDLPAYRQEGQFSAEWHATIDRLDARSSYEGPHWSVTKAALERERATPERDENNGETALFF